MPQFKPSYIAIPKEVKADPERFGLHQHSWPAAKYPSLDEIESCNQIALQENAEAMLTKKQYERYLAALAIIIGAQRDLGIEGDTHPLAESDSLAEDFHSLQAHNDRKAMRAWIK